MPYLILVSAMLLAISMWAPLLCIPPMEHILYEQLQVSHAQTSLLYNVPLWMVGAVALPAGLLADRIGFRKAGGIGATLIAAGSLLRCMTTDFNALLASVNLRSGKTRYTSARLLFMPLDRQMENIGQKSCFP